jgi:hypothetical protein
MFKIFSRVHNELVWFYREDKVGSFLIVLAVLWSACWFGYTVAVLWECVTQG